MTFPYSQNFVKDPKLKNKQCKHPHSKEIHQQLGLDTFLQNLLKEKLFLLILYHGDKERSGQLSWNLLQEKMSRTRDCVYCPCWIVAELQDLQIHLVWSTKLSFDMDPFKLRGGCRHGDWSQFLI